MILIKRINWFLFSPFFFGFFFILLPYNHTLNMDFNTFKATHTHVYTNSLLFHKSLCLKITIQVTYQHMLNTVYTGISYRIKLIFIVDKLSL